MTTTTCDSAYFEAQRAVLAHHTGLSRVVARWGMVIADANERRRQRSRALALVHREVAEQRALAEARWLLKRF